jgi:hypothetical protein
VASRPPSLCPKTSSISVFDVIEDENTRGQLFLMIHRKIWCEKETKEKCTRAGTDGEGAILIFRVGTSSSRVLQPAQRIKGSEAQNKHPLDSYPPKEG